ncbi:MAG: 5-(carboxyamino)imidazole ribonucleotide synthase [Phycisphaerales bacterium]
MNVGILGAGQLGRMLAMAGARLGVRCRLFDPAAEACAADVAPVTRAAFDDSAALTKWAAGLDAVTYEFENVPVATARELEKHIAVWPPASALEFCQDRLEEKTLFREIGVGTAKFARVDGEEDLAAAMGEVGLPAVLKTRRMGYDGKGQAVIHAANEAAAAWRAVGGEKAAASGGMILEQWVAFRREMSIIAVRGADGKVVFYPLTQNHHSGGVLRVSRAPAAGTRPGGPLQSEAERIATAALERMRYVGVLAIELFEHEGRLLANEMAPRVHNSGHWTIDGAPVSQFENHLRAVLGLPLGATGPVVAGCAGMVNLVGDVPELKVLCGMEGARVHLYGKSSRTGRKIGHVNVAAADHAELDGKLRGVIAACAGKGIAAADVPAELR